MLSKEPTRVFNYMNRSGGFTYIDKTIEITYKLIIEPSIKYSIFKKNIPNSSTSWNRHRTFNLDNENLIKILNFIELLENTLGIESLKQFKEMQPRDLQNTSSDDSSLKEWIGLTDYT